MINKIILICSICLNRNYSFHSSSLVAKDRLMLNKFCRTCNRHQSHQETR